MGVRVNIIKEAGAKRKKAVIRFSFLQSNENRSSFLVAILCFIVLVVAAVNFEKVYSMFNQFELYYNMVSQEQNLKRVLSFVHSVIKVLKITSAVLSVAIMAPVLMIVLYDLYSYARHLIKHEV